MKKKGKELQGLKSLKLIKITKQNACKIEEL